MRPNTITQNIIFMVFIYIYVNDGNIDEIVQYAYCCILYMVYIYMMCPLIIVIEYSIKLQLHLTF